MAAVSAILLGSIDAKSTLTAETGSAYTDASS
jgi:hypothetical protein